MSILGKVPEFIIFEDPHDPDNNEGWTRPFEEVRASIMSLLGLGYEIVEIRILPFPYCFLRFKAEDTYSPTIEYQKATSTLTFSWLAGTEYRYQKIPIEPLIYLCYDLDLAEIKQPQPATA